MNLLQQIKQEKNNIIDPIILFESLSALTGESVRLIASFFARYNDDIFDEIHLNFYEYDEVRGAKKIDEHYNENTFIESIARGYGRVIITSDLDEYSYQDEDNVGYWALALDGKIETNINGIIVQRPFYFDKHEVIQYLNFHNIPLPSCITDEVIDNTTDYCINNKDNKLQQRINQLEQELADQKKINDKFVNAPFYENSREFLKDCEQSKNSSFNDDDFISLRTLIDTITKQYSMDISQTARILLIIIIKHNILMYEHSLLSGIAPYSEKYHLKAKELLNLLAEGICVATNIKSENYRTSINKWDSLTHRFPLYDKIALKITIIQDSFNEERNKMLNAVILPDIKHSNKELQQELEQAKKEIEELNRFIQLNNITELTEEYLKSRERNNYHSLIGGLLFLLLKDSDRNLNQNTVIISLQEKFTGEPFSERSLQDKFANAKRQLLSNHPNIKFD